VQHRELTQLAEAWSSLKQRFPKEVSDANSNSNLITNGKLRVRHPQRGTGLACYPNGRGYRQPRRAGALDGGRALRITFDGSRNLNYSHVFEYVTRAAEYEVPVFRPCAHPGD